MPSVLIYTLACRSSVKSWLDLIHIDDSRRAEHDAPRISDYRVPPHFRGASHIGSFALYQSPGLSIPLSPPPMRYEEVVVPRVCDCVGQGHHFRFIHIFPCSFYPATPNRQRKAWQQGFPWLTPRAPPLRQILSSLERN